ncbi:hypothetical protein HNQ59_000794 [Chitinivorax tropicus]|uniref:DUF4390 domain-containing protein n=1 Tax=Chitinivorax tropicus TaxID=714531 RepID=A0A840MJ38_9PROT|nr:hypothetical protein [Chitinivorax tropicus]MBB5017525.1 hypothetical protein [Chitinivorax tropicus]
MRHLSAILLVLIGTWSAAVLAEVPPLSRLVIDTRGIDARFGKIELSDFSRPVTHLTADSLEALSRFRFSFPGAQQGAVRLEAQLETSLTVTHPTDSLTLADWKHHQTPWQVLEAVDAQHFGGPRFTDDDESQFPKVNNKDIMQALAKLSGVTDSLRRQAENCTTALTFPCAVSANLVRVRVSIKQGEHWQPLHEIRFNLPPP